VVEGFEHCLHHVPDDELADAEAVVGFNRCRTRFGQPDACRYIAMSYVDDDHPPVCKVHLSGFMRQVEAIRRTRNQVLDRKAELMAAMGAAQDGDYETAVELWIGRGCRDPEARLRGLLASRGEADGLD
jgi:hypothetical protein